MFDDVLGALTRASSLDAVLVVTADAGLAARAAAVGALAIDEGEPRGLNAAVGLGTDAARTLHASTVLVVLSDIPLIEPEDVDELISRSPQQGALLVPCKDGTGTNAMIRTPPTLFQPCFGGRSLERHVAAAERQRATCVLWRSPRVGFDIDTPEDLKVFAAGEGRTATHREVLRLEIAPLPPPA
jgi:2-phospho-L-lactate guanylyltransferase